LLREKKDLAGRAGSYASYGEHAGSFGTTAFDHYQVCRRDFRFGWLGGDQQKMESTNSQSLKRLKTVITDFPTE